MAATATTIAYSATHPLSAKLASFQVSRLDWVTAIAFIGAFATVGALLAWKRPENPIGWLLSAIGLVFAVAVFSVFLAHFPQTLALANWLGFWYLPGAGLCAFVVLLFPTGHLPSAAGGRWPGPLEQAWPAGSWAARSLPRSSRPARRCGIRSE